MCSNTSCSISPHLHLWPQCPDFTLTSNNSLSRIFFSRKKGHHDPLNNFNHLVLRLVETNLWHFLKSVFLRGILRFEFNSFKASKDIQRRLNRYSWYTGKVGIISMLYSFAYRPHCTRRVERFYHTVRVQDAFLAFKNSRAELSIMHASREAF